MTGRGRYPPLRPDKWYGFAESPFGLFVLVDIPNETIESIINEINDAANLNVVWLATEGDGPAAATMPMNPEWTSPFLGKDISDIVQYLKPLRSSKDSEKRHFLVVDDTFLHDGRGLVKAYRVEDDFDRAEVIEILGKPGPLASFTCAFRPDQWGEYTGYWTPVGEAYEHTTSPGPPPYPKTPERGYKEAEPLLGLFVLVHIPNETIEKIINEIYDSVGYETVWLATEGEVPTETTMPINPGWTSPFLNKTVSDVLQFLKSIRQSSTGPFKKRHFLVIDDELLYKKRGSIKAYRVESEKEYEDIEDKDYDREELTVIAGKPSHVALFAYVYHTGQWEDRADEWKWLGHSMGE